MEVPLREDAEFGLTAAQIALMPERLAKRVETLEEGDPERERMERDLPVWEAAASQVEGQDGRWSIDWDAVRITEAVFEEYGARNSKADSGRIQAAHDTLVGLGAKCGDEADMKESFDDDLPTYTLQENAEGALERVTINESGDEGAPVTLREAGAEFDDATQTVRVTPIRPGPGNRRDGFFYKPEVLREAVRDGKFTNVKMYANHPARDGSDDKKRPERDVRDWVAVVRETTWDERAGRPRSTVQVVDPSVYAKWKAAPEHVAFSVLGNGSARPGRVNGQDMRIVESIEKVRSIDWVTEAGAGGGIDFAESGADEEFEMELKDLTKEQAMAAHPEWFSEADDEDDADTGAATDKPADAEAPANGIDQADADQAKDADVKESAVPEGFVSKAEFDALARKIAEKEMREAVTTGKARAQALLGGALQTSGLPRAARQYLQQHFSEAAIGEGLAYGDETTFQESVADEVRAMQGVFKGIAGSSSVVGMGALSAPADEQKGTGASMREAKEAAIGKRLGNESMPTPKHKPVSNETGVPADGTVEGATSANVADRIASRIN